MDNIDQIAKDIDKEIIKKVILIGRYTRLCESLDIEPIVNFETSFSAEDLEELINKLETIVKINNL